MELASFMVSEIGVVYEMYVSYLFLIDQNAQNFVQFPGITLTLRLISVGILCSSHVLEDRSEACVKTFISLNCQNKYWVKLLFYHM